MCQTDAVVEYSKLEFDELTQFITVSYSFVRGY